MRVTVCTSFAADREPRAPRHARAFHDLGNTAVTFIDAAPIGTVSQEIEAFRGLSNFEWRTCYYPTRSQRKAEWFALKVLHRLALKKVNLDGSINNLALTPNLRGFQRTLVASNPDVIMAHNIDTLLPAYLAAKRCGAKLIFDSMEFHSEMGEDQLAPQVKLIQRIENLCLPACSLVTTVSRHAVELLSSEYQLQNVIALHNVPSSQDLEGNAKTAEFGLYWRNSTLGLGQRGLGDAICALSKLPEAVTLHLQGRLANDNGASITQLAQETGVADRVVIHPPYGAGAAIREASRFHVGLCMEHAGIRNHEIALSNKVFDYHMAGLAIVASDLPAMSDLIKRSQGGLTYKPGDADALATQISKLYNERELYRRLSENAHRFALAEGNVEFEMQRFRESLLPILQN